MDVAAGRLHAIASLKCHLEALWKLERGESGLLVFLWLLPQHPNHSRPRTAILISFSFANRCAIDLGCFFLVPTICRADLG